MAEVIDVGGKQKCANDQCELPGIYSRNLLQRLLFRCRRATGS